MPSGAVRHPLDIVGTHLTNAMPLVIAAILQVTLQGHRCLVPAALVPRLHEERLLGTEACSGKQISSLYTGRMS
jgi:hypothetical protein